MEPIVLLLWLNLDTINLLLLMTATISNMVEENILFALYGIFINLFVLNKYIW